MKYFYLIILFIFATSCAPQEESFQAIVIENVTTIDAVHGVKKNQTLVIKGNKITETGSANKITTPENAVVIDGTGKFVIPGLWDAHVHLSYEEDLSPAMFQLFLVNGVTSIRDTGGQLDLVMPWKKISLADDGSSPRVMVAGPLLDGVPTVYNGEGGRPALGVGASNPSEVKARVDEFVEVGVDLIKSYEMLTPESFHAAIERSTELGKQVTGHVPLSMDVIEASDAGLRSMEHMRNLEMASSANFDSLLKARQKMLAEGSDELGGDLRSSIHSAQRIYAIETQDSARRDLVLRALARNETWQIPTLTIVAAMENRVFDRPEWREDFQYLPDSVSRRWTEQAENFSRNETPATSIQFANWGYDMVHRINKKNIGIMAGTDTPIFFLTPGFSLHEELRLLVKSGLTPMEAITAATLRPAEYFDLQDELGTVAQGMLADLILLDANPLEDISNTQKINAVIKSGKLYDRQDLDDMLTKLKNN